MSWLHNYMKDVWVPSKVDLERLRDSIQPTIKKYEQIYQPIRNKIFAHRDMGVNIQMFLEKSLISDIEHIIYTARDTLEAIQRLEFHYTPKHASWLNDHKPHMTLRGDRACSAPSSRRHDDR